MIRSFLALAIPPEQSDLLMDLQDGPRAARWTDAEGFHLTLAFLGELDRPTLEDLDAGLLGVSEPRFSLTLSGTGVFGGERPRALYAGVADGAPVRRLSDKVTGVAEAAGVAVDRRRYTPHVTLARCKRGEVSAAAAEAWAAANALFKAPAFEVTRFTLYRSDLGRDGPVYEPMAAYPLR